MVDINGNTWTAAQVEGYNAYTKRINASANQPLDSDSLAMNERETYLNRRHAYYTGVASLNNL
tara:strand:+ start:300 stop:488 length:189 start_codon:yes stop_codon:yes gene_type:complete